MKQAINFLSGLRKKVRSLSIPSTAFALTLGSLSAASAHADDLDVYVKALSSSGGAPAILFQLDNSGSMRWTLSDTSTANDILVQRMYRMIDVAMAQATGMKSTFKVGVSTYKDDAGGNGNTGQILQPVATLSDFSAVTSPYTFKVNDEHDDVTQVDPGPGYATWPAYPVDRDGTYLALSASKYYGYTAATVASPYSGTWPDAAYAALRTTYYPSFVGSAGHAAGQMAGLRGNVVFWYRHDDGDQRVRFRVTAATQNTYLMVTDSSGGVIYKETSLDNEYVSSDCASAGNTSCISMRNGSSAGQLRNGYWYRVVVGTDTPSVVGTFTIDRTCYTSTSGTTTKTCDANSLWQKETAPSAVPAEGRIGLNFARVNIPQGATINSAQVRFKSYTTSRGPSSFSWRVGIDTNMTPQQIGDGLFMRTMDWGPDQVLNSWSTNEVGADTTIDLTAQLQTHVNTPGWCGQDLSVQVAPASTWPAELPGVTAGYVDPLFYAYAYDATWATDDTIFQQPELIVDWTDTGATPTGCDAPVITAKVENSSDDIQQGAGPTYTIDTDASVLTVSSTKKVALRFPLIPLPSGVTIKHAYLDLIPSTTVGAPTTIDIQAVDSAVPSPFASTAGAIDALPLGAATVSWTPTTWTAPSSYWWNVMPANVATSPDLASIIDPILQRTDWTYDSGVELVLTSTAATDMSFYSWERQEYGSNTANRAQYGQYVARLRLEVSSPTEVAVGQRTNRWMVNSAMNSLTASHNTPILGAYIESAQYMTGRDGYTMPDLAVGDCGTNGIILLTDGEETGSGYGSTHRTAAQAMFNPPPPAPPSCSTSSTSDQWKCTQNVASGIYNTGVTIGGNKVSIRTDAIGFGPEVGSSGGLKGLGPKGGGKFYNAADSAALTNAFADIVSQVSVPSTTIAASGVAVNALNRFEHLDQLYYSLFTPSNTVNWAGNLKRYRLLNSKVVDVNNAEAIDLTTTGFFGDDARSYWSNEVDGGAIAEGGAAADNPSAGRKLLTYLSASEPSDTFLTDVVDAASGITNVQLGLPVAAPGSDRAKVIDFLRQSPVGDSTKAWGPAIHNSPRVVTYDTADPATPVITVFYADNRGILHAVDAGALSSDTAATNLANAALSDGKELFGFIPKELLKNSARLQANTDKVSDGYVYGLDGDITLYREDTDADGSLDKALLFMGMRRGGKDYYALDVTNARRDASDPTPTLKWIIRGGAGDFSEMGQSWSAMSGTYVQIGGTKTPVLVFSGGYDTAYHDDGAFSDVNGLGFTDTPQAGRAIYMVNPETGALLWKTTQLSTTDFPALAQMKYSIVATPRILDRNGDGIADALYVVDLAGQVFRIELSPASDWSTMVTNVVLVAELGATAGGADPVIDNRRFYEAPSIARLGSDITIALGSGYREEPRSKKTAEAIYVFKDVGAYAGTGTGSLITMGSLDNLTAADVATGVDPSKPGWYIMLDQSTAEKAIGSPRIFSNIVLFPVWNSQTADLGCAPDIGRTELGAMDLYGRALISQRFVDIDLPGFGDTPQMLFQANNELAVAVGVRVISLDDICPNCGGVGDWGRSRWYQIEPE